MIVYELRYMHYSVFIKFIHEVQSGATEVLDLSV